MRKVSIILTAVMLLAVLAGCAAEISDRPFDYYTDCTTENDLAELSEKPFVESVFPFTLLILQRPGYDNPMNGHLAVLATPSFDDLETSVFNQANLVKRDTSIMQDPEMNPILIDSDLAGSCHLSVGDTMYQDTKISDTPLKFTVAGIYRHNPVFAQFEAVALINEQISLVFSDIVEELGYTNAYVKASDPDALKDYFENEFIPHLMTDGLTEEEIASLPREDLQAYYEDYQTHINRMRS